MDETELFWNQIESYDNNNLDSHSFARKFVAFQKRSKINIYPNVHFEYNGKNH